MNARQSRKAKRPRGAERPYPWQCHHCGKREVRLAKTNYAAEVRHDGRLHAFTIADLRTVWVNLSAYQKDLLQLRKGQKVTIIVGPDTAPVSGSGSTPA